MKAYKGFNKNMTCRGFQFEEGKTYREDEADLCSCGFHACENPLDCFAYYNPAYSVFYVVELEEVSDQRGDDSKIVGKQITVGKRLSMDEMVDAAIEYIQSKVKVPKKLKITKSVNTGYGSTAVNTDCRSTAANTGHRSTAVNTGNFSKAVNTGKYSTAVNTDYRSTAVNTGSCSAAVNTGDFSTAVNTGKYSTAVNTGDFSTAEVTRQESVAIATGQNSKAKASLGAAIVIVERGERSNDEGICPIKSICSGIVDGTKLKADTWYTVRDGEFVEVDE